MHVMPQPPLQRACREARPHVLEQADRKVCPYCREAANTASRRLADTAPNGRQYLKNAEKEFFGVFFVSLSLYEKVQQGKGLRGR